MGNEIRDIAPPGAERWAPEPDDVEPVPEVFAEASLDDLLLDVALATEGVVLSGALGYGLEYTYSVMERVRLAALAGDGAVQQPLIVTAGFEAWRQKEARTDEGVPAEWGDWGKRAVLWEANTAVTLLETGAGIVVLRHPDSVRLVKQAIDGLMTSTSPS